jgi:hypothetical protein
MIKSLRLKCEAGEFSRWHAGVRRVSQMAAVRSDFELYRASPLRVEEMKQSYWMSWIWSVDGERGEV